MHNISPAALPLLDPLSTVSMAAYILNFVIVSIGVFSNRKNNLLSIKEYRRAIIRIFTVIFVFLMIFSFVPIASSWIGLVFSIAPMIAWSVIAYCSVGRLIRLDYNGKWALLLGIPYFPILFLGYLLFKSHASDPIEVGPYDDMVA